jgi:hypothetical protein
LYGLEKWFLLLAGGAAMIAGAGGANSASQQTFITVVIQKETAPGLVIGYRTSDAGATFVNCTITGSSATCSKENTNSSTKNLGEILCLPTANAKADVSQRCQKLINDRAGSCQTNSSSGKCPSGATPVMPACNYRTTANMANTANWVWNVAASPTQPGLYEVDCVNAGFQGPNPK